MTGPTDDDSYLDYLKMYNERWRSLMDALAAKFIVKGFNRPSELELRRIAMLNWCFPDEALVQDTGNLRDGRRNTREPVEKLLSALAAARRAYVECLNVADIKSPPGRLNVSGVFIECMEADPFGIGSDLSALEHWAEDVLKKGKPSKKRDARYDYDEFIERVWSACAPMPRDRNHIVSLLFDCEKIALPKSHQGLLKSKVGKRFDEFRKRLPERRKAQERFWMEPLDENGGIIGLPGGDAKDA